MKKIPKTYCRYPFKQAIVSASGLMKFCYYNFFPYGTNTKYDYTFPDNKKHINDVDDINDWFRGSYMDQVRKSMLEGKPLKECIGCYQCEERGKQSFRQEANYNYFKKDKNKPLDYINFETVHLKFGNKCNLKLLGSLLFLDAISRCAKNMYSPWENKILPTQRKATAKPL